jgi:preprotein translocase subunit YajC
VRTERRQRKEISFQSHLLNRSKSGNDVLVPGWIEGQVQDVRSSPMLRQDKEKRVNRKRVLASYYISFHFKSVCCVSLRCVVLYFVV